MNMPTYFTLSFMIRKGQQKRSGEVPIFARLTISGQRTEFNINRSVEPENWNSSKGVAKGRAKKDLELNKYLDSIRCGDFFRQMQKNTPSRRVHQLRANIL